MKLSAKEKIAKYLATNETRGLTVSQARARFGIQNVSARIEELRKEGHAIYLNSRINANGNKVSFYRLGTPTKRIVAAGIMALRQAGEPTFA